MRDARLRQLLGADGDVLAAVYQDDSGDQEMGKRLLRRDVAVRLSSNPASSR